MSDRVITSGLVTAVEEVQVAPLIEGQPLEALMADVGDMVTKDQVLAVLSRSTLELQATEAVEHATQMGLQMQMALEWGLMSTSPPAVGKPSFQELQAHFESQRFAMRAQVAQMLMVSTALAYEGLSNAELSQLLQRANSPVGKALYVDFSRRLYQTLVQLSERLGQTAGRQLAQRPA
jgi:multidrug efflux pump subunit AcrA (membrane-fusion protein)